MEIGSANWKNILSEGAEILGVSVDGAAIDQFCAHGRELLHWNRKFNLTAITDPLEIAVKHFLDSISIADLIPPQAVVLDVGSGGGFPGIPLKIVLPSIQVTLIDASRKKVNFMKHVCRFLGLENIDAHHLRIEALGDEAMSAEGQKRGSQTVPAPNRRYEVITSRAVVSLDRLVEVSFPILADGGRIIALKGNISEVELDGARRVLQRLIGSRGLGRKDRPVSLKRFKLPFLNDQRTIGRITLPSGRDNAPMGALTHF